MCAWWVSDNICGEVQCGKGTCEANQSYPFNFKCNCENGWKRTRLDDEQNLEYLPCIIPDCNFLTSAFYRSYKVSQYDGQINCHNYFDRKIYSNCIKKLLGVMFTYLMTRKSLYKVLETHYI